MNRYCLTRHISMRQKRFSRTVGSLQLLDSNEAGIETSRFVFFVTPNRGRLGRLQAGRIFSAIRSPSRPAGGLMVETKLSTFIFQGLTNQISRTVSSLLLTSHKEQVAETFRSPSGAAFLAVCFGVRLHMSHTGPIPCEHTQA